jgi:hypothetical protein
VVYLVDGIISHTLMRFIGIHKRDESRELLTSRLPCMW